MRLIVCGGRNYGKPLEGDGEGRGVKSDDEAKHERAFLVITMRRLLDRGLVGMAHGGASGADTLAALWCTEVGVDATAYPVDHDLDGPWPSAGPCRNARMLAAEFPRVAGVLAFRGGQGTRDMCQRAYDAGLKIWAPA